MVLTRSQDSMVADTPPNAQAGPSRRPAEDPSTASQTMPQDAQEEDNFHIDIEGDNISTEELEAFKQGQTETVRREGATPAVDVDAPVPSVSNSTTVPGNPDSNANASYPAAMVYMSRFMPARTPEETRLKHYASMSIALLNEAVREERSKIAKPMDNYEPLTQHKLDLFIRKCNQTFEIRPVTYRYDLDRIHFAQQYLQGDAADVWERHCEHVLKDSAPTWLVFKNVLQEQLAPLRIREINVGQQLHDLKQRDKQPVSKLCNRLDTFEDQLPFPPHEYQRKNNLLFALLPGIRDLIIGQHNACNTRQDVEEAALLIERTKSYEGMPNPGGPYAGVARAAKPQASAYRAPPPRPNPPPVMRRHFPNRQTTFLPPRPHSAPQAFVRQQYASPLRGGRGDYARRSAGKFVPRTTSNTPIECWHCGKAGHTKAECRLISRVNSSYSGKAKGL